MVNYLGCIHVNTCSQFELTTTSQPSVGLSTSYPTWAIATFLPMLTGWGQKLSSFYPGKTVLNWEALGSRDPLRLARPKALGSSHVIHAIESIGQQRQVGYNVTNASPWGDLLLPAIPESPWVRTIVAAHARCPSAFYAPPYSLWTCEPGKGLEVETLKDSQTETQVTLDARMPPKYSLYYISEPLT